MNYPAFFWLLLALLAGLQGWTVPVWPVILVAVGWWAYTEIAYEREEMKNGNIVYRPRRLEQPDDDL